MHNLIKKVNSNLRNFSSICAILLKDSKTHILIKVSIGVSSAILLIVYYLSKDKRLILVNNYANIGYLRIIKPDVNKYNMLTGKSSFHNFAKKFYSYPNGITNFGSNCYINVLLQCLSSNPDFILYMKSFLEFQGQSVHQNDYQILKGLLETLEQINSENSTISPKRLINSLNNKFAFEHEQQDSYELYQRLLELFNHNSDSRAMNPFNIELETHYKCKSCKNLITKDDHSVDLSVTPDYSNYSIESLISKSFRPVDICDYTCSKCTVMNILDQCNIKINNLSNLSNLKSKLKLLKEHLETKTHGDITESVDNIVLGIVNFCEENKCLEILGTLKLNQVKSDLVKVSTFKKYPKILTIHVQKVFFEEYAVQTKNVKIVFPEFLTYRHQDKDRRYELTSFIEHFGSHSFGHYISYRKFINNWLMLNDSSVKVINRAQAFEVSNPYMLFYRQV